MYYLEYGKEPPQCKIISIIVSIILICANVASIAVLYIKKNELSAMLVFVVFMLSISIVYMCYKKGLYG